MGKITRIRYGGFKKLEIFISNEIELKRDEVCIVEGERGEEMAGEVVIPPFESPQGVDLTQFKRVVRKATKEDLDKIEANRKSEEEILKRSAHKIKEKELKMKLIKVEKSFDGGKIIFYFTAEGRVDFRELVKDFAYEFRARIEMRQIGVRDQARIIQGYGTCGRAFCCCYFLNEFDPVSIKMAKVQNLTLNPSKISGVCGRLMCCLKYEYETYKDINKDLPKYGKKVTLKDGKSGKVRKVNTLGRTVIVELEDGTNVNVSADDLTFDKTHQRPCEEENEEILEEMPEDIPEELEE